MSRRTKKLVGATVASVAFLTAGGPGAVAQSGEPTEPEPLDFDSSEIEFGPITEDMVSEPRARSIISCPDLRQCAWSGTYRSGARLALAAGNSYNWNTWSSSYCTRADSGGTFKNCARSTQNRNQSFNFTWFMELNGGGSFWPQEPNSYFSTLWPGFDQNIESSVGF